MHLRPIARYGLFVAACVLVLAADFPWRDLQDHPHWAEVGRIPFLSGPIEAGDLAGNVILGAPVGAATALLVRRAVLVAAVVTLPISVVGEAIQIYSHERFPSATDVVCNVAGAMAAAGVATSWKRRRRVAARAGVGPAKDPR